MGIRTDQYIGVQTFEADTATITTLTVTSPGAGASIVFEGATADAFETTLTVTDPTADRTITLPNATGTVSLLSSAETYTGAKTFGTGGTAVASLIYGSGTVTSGQTSVAASATGVTSSSRVQATIKSGNTNGVFVKTAVASTDTVTITLSGDPGASCVVEFLAYR